MADDLHDPRPHSRMTVRVRRDALVDAAAYRFVKGRAKPEVLELERIGAEVDEALDLFERRGWVADPAAYHQTPRPIDGARTHPARTANVRYTAMTWSDGWAPHPEEPGTARFLGYPKNPIARAALLEHRGAPRPWLVVLHGFGMGTPGLDLRAFRALHLHKDLGLNLAFLTMPFHGPRNPGSRMQPPMPGIDALDNVHGLTQAVWDARQLLAFARERADGNPVGILGLSLGSLVASVVASVDDPHAVLLHVPAIDLPQLMTDAAAGIDDPQAQEGVALMERARPLYGPVNPLHLSPQVPVERRFLFAGTLDKFAKPSTQAIRLWHHWDEPHVHWYHGGHVSLFWAKGIQDAVDKALVDSGLT